MTAFLNLDGTGSVIPLVQELHADVPARRIGKVLYRPAEHVLEAVQPVAASAGRGR